MGQEMITGTLSSQKPGRGFTDTSKEFIQACQDLQWTHDANTPKRSETNEMAERAVQQAKEGTATAMVQSGLPDQRLDHRKNR